MNGYSNSELVDMLLMYGEAGQNCRLAQRYYAERFPGRRHPNSRIFVSLTQRLRDTGSLQPNRGRDGGAHRRPVNVENAVLDLVRNDPTISIRRISRQLPGVPRMTIWRILRNNNLHPYHFQRVHALIEPDHYSRVRFCEWLLNQHAQDGNFTLKVIFSDEAIFTRDGIHNIHNCHYWAEENPHAAVRSHFQHRFSLNVWAGMVNGSLLGPYILPNRMSGNDYLQFLQNNLPELLEDIPLNVRQNAWFMHDGAPPHFARNVRHHLDRVFEDRWIGRGGPASWPPRSPDFNPLDFYLWGNFKSLVYDNQEAPETLEELRQRVENCAERIRQENAIHRACSISLIQRAALCLAVNGNNFEQFL